MSAPLPQSTRSPSPSRAVIVSFPSSPSTKSKPPPPSMRSSPPSARIDSVPAEPVTTSAPSPRISSSMSPCTLPVPGAPIPSFATPSSVRRYGSLTDARGVELVEVRAADDLVARRRRRAGRCRAPPSIRSLPLAAEQEVVALAAVQLHAAGRVGAEDVRAVVALCRPATRGVPRCRPRQSVVAQRAARARRCGSCRRAGQRDRRPRSPSSRRRSAPPGRSPLPNTMFAPSGADLQRRRLRARVRR